MRKLKNILYVMQDELFLIKKGETIQITKDKQKVAQLPIHNLEGIVVFGNCVVTPALLEMCYQYNVHVSFISRTGKFRAKIQAPTSGNVVLRRAQYRIADDEQQQLKIAKWIIMGKLYNSKKVLSRLLRDYPERIDVIPVKKVINILQADIRKIEHSKNHDKIRGYEGDAAKNYFSVFNALILKHDAGFEFHGRSKHPPLDEINCLLSFFYTLLSHEIGSALETVGLDPQVGFLHMERSGKAALAFDLIEELRAYMVDRFVVTLINNRQIDIKGFIKQDNGAILLKDETKKLAVNEWQKRKNAVITHPFLKEKIEIGLIPYVQALLLARYIRGDLDAYPVFLMR